MRVESDRWLSGVFEYPVYRLQASAAGDAEGDPADALRRHRAAQTERAFYYAKADTRDVALTHALTGGGMAVVDVSVTLGLEPAAACGLDDANEVLVRECDAADSAGVLDIAGRAFRYSRFHLDPLVPIELAHRVKREWMANYVRKARGEALLVARIDGRPAGFLAVIDATDGGRRAKAIDLIAVDEGARRRGVGGALVAAFIRRFSGCADLLQVGTQVANAPSLALYQRFGFTVRHSAYVLHLHHAPVTT